MAAFTRPPGEAPLYIYIQGLAGIALYHVTPLDCGRYMGRTFLPHAPAAGAAGAAAAAAAAAVCVVRVAL